MVATLGVPGHPGSLRGSRSYGGSSALGATSEVQLVSARKATLNLPDTLVAKPDKHPHDDNFLPLGLPIITTQDSQQGPEHDVARDLPVHLRATRSWTNNEDAMAWKLLLSSDIVKYPEGTQIARATHSFDNNICATCSTLNLPAAMSMDGSSLENAGLELCDFVGLNRSRLHSGCTLCRAFASILPATVSSQSAHTIFTGKLYALPASHISGLRAGVAKLPVVLGISLETNPIRWDAVAHCTTELQGLFLPMARNLEQESESCHGVELHTNVGFERVRSMLSRCAKNHHQCRTPSHDFPVRARVIDCRSRKVVSLKQGDRYLALSYVWGSRSAATVSMMDSDAAAISLPETLPGTISDAMLVTIKLGLQYLWCDRYCIEQYHSADKKHQINQMASIYNRAVATICALGADDEAGLPGITRMRSFLGSFNLYGSSYTICPAPTLLINHISSSRWASRGWTFQEALLSRRCLFFTAEQAHLVCCSSTQHEGILQGTRKKDRMDRLSWGTTATIFSTILDAELRWFRGIDGQLKFYDYMQHYLQRRFTVDEDALPAFKGILSLLGNQSYYGVVVFICPISELDTDADMIYRKRLGFVHGLLWEIDQRAQSAARRFSVPTWTWLSRTYTRPRYSTLDAQLSSNQNSLGLMCLTSPVLQPTFVAGVAVVPNSGPPIDVGHFLYERKDTMVVKELTTSLDITSVSFPISWKVTKKLLSKSKGTEYVIECTFQTGEPVSYTLTDQNARFDVSRAEDEEKRGVAVLLLAEQNRGDPVYCTYRWLIVQSKEVSLATVYERMLQSKPREDNAVAALYERIALFTFKEVVSGPKASREFRMAGMIEEYKSKKTLRIQ